MSEQTLKAAAAQNKGQPTTRPYPPSFVDRITASVLRLPVPFWVTYLVLFLVSGLLNNALGWWDGWLPLYSLDPVNFLFPLWLFAPLAIITHLDRLALNSLREFNQILQLPDDDLHKLEYEFTNMPARTVIANGILWFFFFSLVQYAGFDGFYVANGVGLAATIFGVVFGYVANWFGSAIYLHTYRQLRLVNRTVKLVRRFNLFDLEPVYAFSRVTAQTGLAWVFLLAGTTLFFPIELTNILIILLNVAMIIFAISAFVLPLWAVHRGLVGEKRRLLAARDRRVSATLARLHSSLDDNQLDEIGKLNTAMSGLITEREVLERIPTWPWRAGTFSRFLSAIVLPIFLFLVQLILGNLIEG